MKEPKSINWDELENNPHKYAKELKIKKLEELLRYVTYKYYNSKKTIISDEVYDILLNLLKKVAPKSKYLDEVGAPIKNEKKKVTLPFPMNSLDKIKPDTEALKKWAKKYKGSVIISDKLDGNSAMLYKNTKKYGKNIKLYSRGKKGVGQDNSHLVSYLFDKKLLDKLPKKIAIRGELIISKKNFEKVIKYLLKTKQVKKEELKRVNARNTLAGVINSKTLNETRKKILSYIEFVPYWILYPDKITPNDQFKQLKKWGFNTAYYKKKKSVSNKKLSKLLVKRKDKSKYVIDGLVIIENKIHTMPKDKNPDFAFAFKSILTEDQAESTVQEVIWKVSKDGYFKPVIRIEPFYTEGVEIKKATVNNAKFVVDNVIGPGSVVLMTRSNNVIPKVVKVLKESQNGKPQMPKEKYKWNKSNVDIVSTDKSTKKSQKIMKLTYFFKKLQVKHISEGIVKKLVNDGYSSVKKILKGNPKDFAKIDGLGLKSAKKFSKNLNDRLNETSLEQFMAASQAFGRNFGEERFSLILKTYPNIIAMGKELSGKKLLKKIMSIKGFAKTMALTFVEGLPKFKKFVKSIKKYFNYKLLLKKTLNKAKEKLLQKQAMEEVFVAGAGAVASENSLEDKKIVFTGIRDLTLKKWIEENGGKVTGTVSGSTNILIVAKKSLEKPTSKMTTAQNAGTEIISLEEFKNKYGYPNE